MQFSKVVNKNMKLVSVIIPCYKDAGTLGRAINSVIAQTYPLIEIIVVNDCSPESDSIEALLLDYPQVCYVRNLINVGLAETRNNGLQFASGEIVAFLDADDEYHYKKIEVQVEALEPNMVVSCNVINKLPDGAERTKIKSTFIVEHASQILFRNVLVGACLLAPRDLLMKLGGYNSSLRSCEDFDLWLRFLTEGVKIKFLGAPLYIYYFNPKGLSKNFKNISKWEIEVIKIHADRMGCQWQTKPYYACLILFWLIRHLMRAELSRDNDLRNQTKKNFYLLDDFPLFKFILRVLAHSRLLLLAALLVAWSGGLRH
jgi:glycosyltransferase involved in cell wall biosynthesis